MTTPLYPTFRKRVDDAVDQLIRQQVTPWSFLGAGPPFRIKTFDGRQIAYEGGGFEGSPRQAFWSRYIEPFLEDFCVSEIAAAVSMAKEKGVDARLLLPELQGLLSAGFRKVYARMAEVDRRLRGKGFPDNVELRSIDREVSGMNQFLDELIRAELSMWKPTSRVETMSEKETRFDRIIDRAKNHPVLAVILVFGTLVIALGSFTTTVRDIGSLLGSQKSIRLARLDVQNLLIERIEEGRVVAPTLPAHEGTEGTEYQAFYRPDGTMLYRRETDPQPQRWKWRIDRNGLLCRGPLSTDINRICRELYLVEANRYRAVGVDSGRPRYEFSVRDGAVEELH